MLVGSGDQFVFFGNRITEADPGYTRLLTATRRSPPRRSPD